MRDPSGSKIDTAIESKLETFKISFVCMFYVICIYANIISWCFKDFLDFFTFKKLSNRNFKSFRF